jgi:ribosomal protein S18 acetylase RimI-like enzyme
MDVELCCQLNMTYTTEYVWQMQTRDNGQTINLRFDTIRLPRPMQVEYPRDPAELVEHWQRQGCFLIAYNVNGDVVGFVDAQPEAWQNLLHVTNFVIDRSYRGQGVGTSLLKATKQWASRQGLKQIMFEMQTKNHPAISFAQKHSFQFCGYNERYYTNGDITLFFSRSI